MGLRAGVSGAQKLEHPALQAPLGLLNMVNSQF